MDLTEADFSAESFAFDDNDFPEEYPLSYKEIQYEQGKHAKLQQKLQKEPQRYQVARYKHSDYTYDIITRDGKIVLPPSLQRRAAEWYHLHLLHPGETRMELTMGQHYCWKGMRETIKKVCRSCAICKTDKVKMQKYGLLPPRNPQVVPWHTLCIDLIGPYTFGDPEKKNHVKLWCLTMIDPATGWFEIAEIPTKRADFVINILEFSWLTRYPRPTEVVLDRGTEFAAEVQRAIKDSYGITKKLITTRNPQANSVVERVHQVIHNMIRVWQIRTKKDLDKDFRWLGILSAIRQAVTSTVHTTTRASPAQLVFGRNALLNISFVADWQYIKERKQKLIKQNNKRENRTRIDYQYSVGDKVMIKEDPNRKHGSDRYSGPYTLTQVNDNGTVKLSKVAGTTTRRGAVHETWNIRNIHPCMD